MKTEDIVSTKVTNLGDKGWGVRIFIRGELYRDLVVRDRIDIGPAIREELRMIDKGGFDSPMAAASRDRFYSGPKWAPKPTRDI